MEGLAKPAIMNFLICSVVVMHAKYNISVPKFFVRKSF